MVESDFKSDYKSIEALFSSSLKYRVPPYQRDFSWESNDQIVEFWSDLEESLQSNKEHFFGNILLRKTGTDDLFDILDGQQRIATVTILLAVIRDKLNEIGDPERSRIVQQSIAVITDVRTLTPVPRLTLNLRNKEFFFDYVQRDDNERKFFSRSAKLQLPNTNRLIMQAYSFFEEELEKKLENLLTKEAKTGFLANLSYHTIRNLAVIETRVRSTAEAYRLFMPLNSRGLELSVADLFKSHIIEESSIERKEDVIAIWNEIAVLLDDTGLVNFLRHYWASRIATVAEKDLYDEFVKSLKTEKRDLVRFAKELREEAELYNALSTPLSDYWSGRSREISPLLEEIKALNIKQCFPLLLIGRRKFGDRDFVKLLQSCINFSFRFVTISGLNTKNVERLYGRISIELCNGKISGVESIVAQLKKEYVNDEQFLLNFKKKEITINKVARYILTKIEDFLSKENGLPEKVLPLTLEHILPDCPDGECEIYLKEKKIDKDEFVSRIGNMTLLIEKMNSTAKSKSFTKKRDCYFQKSSLKINEPLKGLTEWSDKEIEQRQAWLGDIAAKIWKLD